MGDTASRTTVADPRRRGRVALLLAFSASCSDPLTGTSAPLDSRAAVSRADFAAIPQQAGPQLPLDESTSIAPYLLELSGTHAVVCWLSRAATIGSVTLHGPEGARTEREAGPASRVHKVIIEDLQPGTSYRYEVDGGHQSRFVTLGPQTHFGVAVFGHTGGTAMPREYHTALLASALSSMRPDITLCTGDIVYHSNVEGFRDDFFRPFAQFLAERPIMLAASNHDCGWPWLHGIDYRNVRRLFPHTYASEVGAYYHFDHGNVRFVAVSYVQAKQDFRQQIAWLADTLDNSRAEFNVVYLGGQSTGYYDKAAFFEELSKHRVDLVLGGDGGGVFQERNSGVPFFFAGDGEEQAHPFYWLQFDKYQFTVRVMDSSGKSRSGFWQFFSTGKKEQVLDLQTKTVPAAPAVLQFDDIGAMSTTFTGLQFDVDWPLDKEIPIQIRWKPHSDRRLGGEGSYREPYRMLLPSCRQTFRIELPDRDHISREPYRLQWLEIQLVPYVAERQGVSVRMADHIRNVQLFRDP